MALDWNTLRYQSRRSDDQGLRARMREIAETKRRYGCPRIYVRLRMEGWRVNHKKVERIYREEGLSLRCRGPASTGAVMGWTLSMTGWPMLAVQVLHDDRSLLEGGAGE